MAKLVIKNPSVTINGVNFSDHCSEVVVTMSKAAVDTTNFSGSGTERVAGLKTDSFEFTLQQDYASGSIDGTLYPLYNNETEFTVVVIPVTAAVSATNPSYTGTCVLLDYQPMQGKVGQLSDTKIKMPAQRTGIARAIV